MKRRLALLLIFFLILPVRSLQDPGTGEGGGSPVLDRVEKVTDAIENPPSGAGREQSKEFARELFAPLLLFLSWFGLNLGSAQAMLQFAAAFVLFYFLYTQLNSQNSMFQGAFWSALSIGLVNTVLRIDWYDFLIRFSPAVLVFLVVRDLVSFVGVLSRRTADWIGLFSLGVTYFLLGERADLFTGLFRGTFSMIADPTKPWVLISLVLLMALGKMAGVMVESMKEKSAMNAKIAFQNASSQLRWRLLQQGRIGEK